MESEELISDIVTDGLITTAVMRTKNPALVNMLRRSIYNVVPTYAIDIVSFDINSSARTSEVIALRLGQCVIDQDKLIIPSFNADIKVDIDVSGPKWFTTSDIPTLPFSFETPITNLTAGQRIKCSVIVRKGTGEIHVKWRPIATFAIDDHPDGFKITMRGIGMMDPKKILTEGLSLLQETSTLPVYTLYSHSLQPEDVHSSSLNRPDDVKS
jgi:DNA-directed RNA polymerase alpha subunit